MNEDLKRISEELHTQDCRSTSHPVYIVRAKLETLVPNNEQWVDVTPFFTNKAAEEYIERHRHNLLEPYVYVGSGYMNEEWQLIRAFLLSLTPSPTKH